MVLVNPAVGAAEAEVEASDADSVTAVKSVFGSAGPERTPSTPFPLGGPLEKVDANEDRPFGPTETVASNGSSRFAGTRKSYVYIVVGRNSLAG